MNKVEFLAALQTQRAEWDVLLDQMDPARMDEPGVEGDYSAKDIIAHVTWYERETLNIIQTHILIGSPHWDLPTQDERNAAIYADIRYIPAAEVLVQSRQVYQQLWAAAQTLTDEDLNDASRFKEMPPDWSPGEVLASNCYEHYQQHFDTLRTWLNKL